MTDLPAEEETAGQPVTQSYRTQHLLAVEGLAENQCAECRAYRADGLPPVLHYRGCSRQWHGAPWLGLR